MTKITATALTENVTQTQHIKGLPTKPTQSNTPSLRHTNQNRYSDTHLHWNESNYVHNRIPPMPLAHE